MHAEEGAQQQLSHPRSLPAAFCQRKSARSPRLCHARGCCVSEGASSPATAGCGRDGGDFSFPAALTRAWPSARAELCARSVRAPGEAASGARAEEMAEGRLVMDGSHLSPAAEELGELGMGANLLSAAKSLLGSGQSCAAASNPAPASVCLACGGFIY